jgi:hypothetical protein
MVNIPLYCVDDYISFIWNFHLKYDLDPEEHPQLLYDMDSAKCKGILKF